MTIAFEYLFFLLFILLAVYIPGILIFRLLKLEFVGAARLTSVIVLGILANCVSTFILRSLGVPVPLIFTTFLILSIVAIIKLKRALFVKIISREVMFLTALSLTIAIVQSLFLLRSGVLSEEGLSFYSSTHDPMHHMSIIGELNHSFGPQNPSFSGYPLKNYHYFTDLFLSQIVSGTQINLFDLYFKIFPIFVSLLFSFSVFAVASKLSSKPYFGYLAVIFVLLGGTASYLLVFVKPGVNWNYGTFFVDQPYNMIFNAQNYIGYSIFLIGSLISLEAKRVKQAILGGVVLALAFPFLAYAALVASSSVAITATLAFVRQRSKLLFVSTLAAAVVGIAFAVMTISDRAYGLYFLPGWSLTQMIASPNDLNFNDWILKLDHYRSTENVLRIAQIYIQSALLFVFGNLGFRIIGLLYLVYLVFSNRLKANLHSFFLIATIISFTVPMLFNQGGSVYDVFRFAHYALIISAIYCALAVDFAANRFKLNKFAVLAISLLIFLAAVPTTAKMFAADITRDRSIVGANTIEVADYIRLNTKTDSIILVCPQNDFARYITGIGQRRVYVSDLQTVNYSGGDVAQRRNLNRDFFEKFSDEQRKSFIRENEIDYVVVSKNRSPFVNTMGLVELAFENDDFFLYRSI